MSAPQIERTPRVSTDSRRSEMPPPPSPGVPSLPRPSIDLSFSWDQILMEVGVDTDVKHKVEKRTSNILKLAEENEKLNAELRAMTERLEAAERKRKALAEQK